MSKRYITHEVCIDEFDTSALEEELKTRRDRKKMDGKELPAETWELSIQEIYYALKFGDNDRALGLMRDYVCEQTGYIL